jgi:hypothetical protein
MSEYAQTYVTKEGQHRQPMMRPQTQGDYSSKEAMQPNTTHTGKWFTVVMHNIHPFNR